jgi:hypothetical protein
VERHVAAKEQHGVEKAQTSRRHPRALSGRAVSRSCGDWRSDSRRAFGVRLQLCDPAGLVGSAGALTARAATFDAPGRWVEIEPNGSSAGYRDMQEFVAGIHHPDLAERLERAIHGRGAFRKFRDALHRHPDLERRWLTFSDDRRRGRARAWLSDAGYAVGPRQPPASAH